QAVKAEQSAKNAIGPSNAMGNAPARAVDAKINSAHALPMPQNAVPQAGALPERKWGEPKSSALAPMTSVQAKGEAMPSPLPLRRRGDSGGRRFGRSLPTKDRIAEIRAGRSAGADF